MIVLSPAQDADILKLWQLFDNWRRTVQGAGFTAKGAPMSAWIALDNVVIRDSKDVRTAFTAARTCFRHWSDGGDPLVAEYCAPYLETCENRLAQLNS